MAVMSHLPDADLESRSGVSVDSGYDISANHFLRNKEFSNQEYSYSYSGY